MKIFSGSSNRPLAEKIAKDLNFPLSPLEIFIFPDQERRVQIQTKVVDQECIVVQSTATPADTHYMELFFIIDALRRSGARSVSVVIPYLGYQRQDHVFREGEAVSLDVVIRTLECQKVDKIIAFDLHTIKIPEQFHSPITHLTALPLFAQAIKRHSWNDTNTVLVAPDMGGIRRIKILSELLDDMPYSSIIKNRDLATGHVEASDIEGEVKDRALIVDDMISSGGTIAAAAALLQSKGVKEIIVFATHPVFSEKAPEILQYSVAEKVIVSDSVYIPEEKMFPKLEILTIAKMVAKEIKKG